MRIGIVGSSVAVAGSAALAALAPSAGAAPGRVGQASGAGYHSAASARVMGLNIAGTSRSLASVTATTGDSPKSAGIGSGQVLSALRNVPVPALGSALAAAFRQANPGNTDLVSETATASADGTSTACAAVLTADCTTRPMSLVLKLGVKDLVAGLAGTALSSVINSLPDPLADYVVVLTINGPRASCSAGPAGSGEVSATDNPAGGTLDIRANGASLLPGGPVSLSGGEVFAQLLGAVKGSPLAPVLQALASQLPLSVTLDPNSRKYTSGSKATATAAEVGLSAAGTTIFDVTSATVSCGANTQAASSAPVPSPSPSTGSSSSGEQPLSGIQSDEGRSATPVAKSYLALTGMP